MPLPPLPNGGFLFLYPVPDGAPKLFLGKLFRLISYSSQSPGERAWWQVAYGVRFDCDAEMWKQYGVHSVCVCVCVRGWV